MAELLLLIAISVVCGKIAGKDGKSGIIWGMVALLICLLCLAIPLPFLRLGIGFVIIIVLMTITNLFFSRSPQREKWRKV